MVSAYYAERIRLGMPVNARFWIYWKCSHVKLTLRPGESVSMFCGGQTDEGFSCEAQTYHFDGETVTCEITTWGRDCDGRHEWQGDSHCHVTKLRNVPADEYGPMRPDWIKGKETQRDEYAEMMGY